MGELSGLKPEKVFYYFEEITKIPHGSYNTGMISNYLADFAKERGLEYVQDELGNVIIIKEASAGYENEPAVILQGHMDMVAVQTPECKIDMKTEGLKVAVDGDKIYAEGTSLGGDDGIAVAYALAILDSDDIKHPKLEVIITVDEEVGLDGAKGVDLSRLEARRMINLDSEEEGIFLTSCAGGARMNCFSKATVSECSGVSLNVKVAGLLGGHSGEMIIKGRGNSNCIIGRVIKVLSDEMNVHLVKAFGGFADNAIPRETEATIVVADDKAERAMALIKELDENVRGELGTRDPGFALTVEKSDEGAVKAASSEDTKRLATFIYTIPNGVQTMSADVEGLVETSLNLGILRFDINEEGKGQFEAGYSVRSSVESSKDCLLDKMGALAQMLGVEYTITGVYPGWKYRVDSPLRDKMIRVFERVYGHAPEVQAIHAGLECGIIAAKLPGLDCISMGPDMADIHTTEETLSISSTARVWEYLLAVLAEKDA